MNTIHVEAAQQSYEVVIGRGLIDQVGALVAQRLKATACAVISDENVARLHANKVMTSLGAAGFRPVLLTAPAGEESKSIRSVETVCDQMICAGLDRFSFVVAVGGGMVGDLTGFVAAIYHRGIPCVHIPTTLLAQVDSSIGGKTAVNTRAGKNLLGAWHQPAFVVSDVDALATLPAREMRQGFAEIVKHAVIRDAEMFDWLRRFEESDLVPLIARNVAIKAAVVAADEREMTGERALLNFGHTIGHAIERAGEYRDFLHGEAVSLGMVAASGISVEKAGLTTAERDRIVATLERFELPTRLPPDFSRSRILDAVRVDKKFAQGEVRFVVVPSIGSARLVTEVTMSDIEAAVAAL